ncbi:hypothetical protein Tsubulata_034304 [Turnera subulata]|uniref:Vacuole membrane protein KMS1 n=1 Tax=Turnera subulata TaxID=218843 RepID=A0A9Q0F5L5_9ROSI|nr:hypothetical protein Tsubulata_034304 [Turnera subulata]
MERIQQEQHSSSPQDMLFSRLREEHRKELENLTLVTQPLRTLKYFGLAIAHFVLGLFARSGKLLLLISGLAAGTLIISAAGSGIYQEHVHELLSYLQFGLWWLALGVASSIGLGKCLFMRYLLCFYLFLSLCICGRIDIKEAPYDTIQFNSGPSWLEKNCSAFGPPSFSSWEVILIWLLKCSDLLSLQAWISFKCLSSSMLEVVKERDSSAEDSTIIANHMKQMKCWLLSHSQYLNFFTILVLASVPNPLFDLAGMMCGQFGVPFWEFFLATLIGKAIIKTYIQTAFIISVCNHQLLDLVENELIWLLGFVPGLVDILPNLVLKLQAIRNKYMAPMPPIAHIEVEKEGLSFASIWNTVICLMLISFLFKIVTATAQGFLKEQQEKELKLASNSSVSNLSHYKTV